MIINTNDFNLSSGLLQETLNNYTASCLSQ